MYGFDDYMGRIFTVYDLNGDNLLTGQEMYTIGAEVDPEGSAGTTVDGFNFLIDFVEAVMFGLPHYHGESNGMMDLQEFTAFLSISF